MPAELVQELCDWYLESAKDEELRSLAANRAVKVRGFRTLDTVPRAMLQSRLREALLKEKHSTDRRILPAGVDELVNSENLALALMQSLASLEYGQNDIRFVLFVMARDYAGDPKFSEAVKTIFELLRRFDAETHQEERRERDKAERAITAAKEQLKAVESEKQRLEREIKKAQKRVAQLEGELQRNKAETERLASALHEAHEERRKAEDNWRKAEEARQHLEASMRAAEKERAALRAVLGAKERELMALRSAQSDSEEQAKRRPGTRSQAARSTTRTQTLTDDDVRQLRVIVVAPFEARERVTVRGRPVLVHAVSASSVPTRPWDDWLPDMCESSALFLPPPPFTRATRAAQILALRHGVPVLHGVLPEDVVPILQTWLGRQSGGDSAAI